MHAGIILVGNAIHKIDTVSLYVVDSLNHNLYFQGIGNLQKLIGVRGKKDLVRILKCSPWERDKSGCMRHN